MTKEKVRHVPIKSEDINLTITGTNKPEVTWTKKDDMIEKSAKFIMRDGKYVGVIPQDSEVKFYKLVEISYGSLEQLFNSKSL